MCPTVSNRHGIQTGPEDVIFGALSYLKHPLQEVPMDRRRPVNKTTSKRAYKRRVRKTAVVNTRDPLRGGIRL